MAGYGLPWLSWCVLVNKSFGKNLACRTCYGLVLLPRNKTRELWSSPLGCTGVSLNFFCHSPARRVNNNFGSPTSFLTSPQFPKKVTNVISCLSLSVIDRIPSERDSRALPGNDTAGYLQRRHHLRSSPYLLLLLYVLLGE